MDKIKEYLTTPKTWISFMVFVFGLGVAWSTLNGRINKLEEFQQTINMVEIQSTLSSIQKDIEWIKTTLINNK